VDETVKEVKRALLVPLLKQKEVPFSFAGAVEPLYDIRITPSKKQGGTIILAAGMGRRLGLAGPKGCVEIEGKSLYEILLRKIDGHVAIMTSPATHERTKQFLQEKGFHYVDLFQSRCLPRLTDAYEESPEGNGALFSTFYGSPLWDKWKEVEEIRVIPIDNPLAEPLDCGYAELTVLAIEKRSTEENVGILVEKEKKLYVCEYTEKPPGRLAYSGIFSCHKSFFERAAKSELPWHRISKNGVEHFEKFAFDAFPAAKSYQIILKERKGVFAPIKTKEDLVDYLQCRR